MKNLLFVLVFTFIGQQSNVIYAQEFTVTPTGLKDNANLEKTYVVINTPGKTAEQNYNNVIKYINKTYKSPKKCYQRRYKRRIYTFCYSRLKLLSCK